MALTNYKLKPPLYPAIQWDGTEGVWEDLSAATSISVVGDYSAETLTINARGQNIDVPIGDWVYVDRNGELQTMTNADFNNTFEIA